MLDKWIPYRSENAVIRSRVFGFSHAGGNAAFYRPLRRFMPAEVDFCPVELPGRAARLDEPPIASMSLLMEQLHQVLRPLMEVPFGFFGHSVGACMAYEAARKLSSATGRTAVHLFVSGHKRPEFPCADAPTPRQWSDRDLVAILNCFGGTPAEIMQRPELIAVLLPALRADLTLAQGYVIDPGSPVKCAITAFGGIDDVSHSRHLHLWRDSTYGNFRIRTFPGGHFYLQSEAESLAKEIARDLDPLVGAHASKTRQSK